MSKGAKKNVLLIGSTGLLGQAMRKALSARDYEVSAAARRGAPVCLDITDDAVLFKTLEDISPHLVVNCAALVDVEACENDPGLAWRCNARPLGLLAEWARANSAILLHISTDQLYVDGAGAAHDETAPVSLANEYARTKYAGEVLALTAPKALVLRTSIVGIRGWLVPTFAEWAIGVVERDEAADLFSDAYTSSIDVTTFCDAALDLLQSGSRGLYNLAAREVYSKEAFVREVAAQLGKPLTCAVAASVSTMRTRRANCLGLSVRRAQDRLGYALPALKDVVTSVLEQRRAEAINAAQ